MKKTIYFLLGCALLWSCNPQQETAAKYEENNALFLKNVDTFKNHFLKGFATENKELMLEMYADSLEWNGPNEAGIPFNKEDIGEVFDNYFENFDDIQLNNPLFFGGSIYSTPMEPSDNPNYLRVVGTWTNKHTASGATTSLKWHVVMWFNEDGKVYRGSDWMDVSSLENQISRQMENE